MMLEINNISKKYRKGSEEFTALDNVSFNFDEGDFIVVNGPSGAGKSTLLYTIGGLIHPDSGDILFKGRNIYNLDAKEKDDYKKKNIGFMFQQFHLMPYLTVTENIKLACHEISYLADIKDYMDKCSLTDLKNKFPSELSVGEKQRTAFIRAIISKPDLLLADEPTGNLDPVNSAVLMSLVEDYHKSGGTVLLVSHDTIASQFSNKRVTIEKGRIELF